MSTISAVEMRPLRALQVTLLVAGAPKVALRGLAAADEMVYKQRKVRANLAIL